MTTLASVRVRVLVAVVPQPWVRSGGKERSDGVEVAVGGRQHARRAASLWCACLQLGARGQEQLTSGGVSAARGMQQRCPAVPVPLAAVRAGSEQACERSYVAVPQPALHRLRRAARCPGLHPLARAPPEEVSGSGRGKDASAAARMAAAYA